MCLRSIGEDDFGSKSELGGGNLFKRRSTDEGARIRRSPP